MNNLYVYIYIYIFKLKDYTSLTVNYQIYLVIFEKFQHEKFQHEKLKDIKSCSNLSKL